MARVGGINLSDTELANPPRYTPITAGVIPFSVAPTTRTIYLLLGLETHKQLWCDFGGRINVGESVEGAAAREFCEESLCAVDLGDASHPNLAQYMDLTRAMLTRGEFFWKLELVHATVDGVEQGRVYFLKEVPWQPQAKRKFSDIRYQLLHKELFVPEMRLHPAWKSLEPLEVGPAWMEKASIKWWSLDRLKDLRRNNGKFRRHRFRSSFLRVLDILLPAFERLLDSEKDVTDRACQSERSFLRDV